MNKFTIVMRVLGYVASTCLVIILIIIGENSIPAVPLVVALSVVLCSVTVSDKP